MKSVNIRGMWILTCIPEAHESKQKFVVTMQIVIFSRLSMEIVGELVPGKLLRCLEDFLLPIAQDDWNCVQYLRM